MIVLDPKHIGGLNDNNFLFSIRLSAPDNGDFITTLRERPLDCATGLRIIKPAKYFQSAPRGLKYVA